jgi:hypothetical protein
MSQCAMRPMHTPAATSIMTSTAAGSASVSGIVAPIGARAPQSAPRGPYEKGEAAISN